MAEKLVLFIKTYNGDESTCRNLVSSIEKYNKDNLPVYISVPESDMTLFSDLSKYNIRVITDESYAGKYLTNDKVNGLSAGYINQEICKLSFWESGIANNYLCLDSDAEFLRDFYFSDFMADENTPYTILVQDKDLYIEKWYPHGYAKHRRQMHQKIFDTVGLNDPRLRSCHGLTVLNATVLKSMKNDFMVSHGYEYLDLLNISPFEFTWYNAWFQKSKIIPEMAVEPFFKTIHTKSQYKLMKILVPNVANFARSYVGIVMNSNWGGGKYKSNRWHKLLFKLFIK